MGARLRIIYSADPELRKLLVSPLYIYSLHLRPGRTLQTSGSPRERSSSMNHILIVTTPQSTKRRLNLYIQTLRSTNVLNICYLTLTQWIHVCSFILRSKYYDFLSLHIIPRNAGNKGEQGFSHRCEAQRHSPQSQAAGEST